MAALTTGRDTREIYCNALNLHRVHTVQSGATVFIGGIAALNSSGNAVPASDTAGLIVTGRAEAFAANGKLITKTGVYHYANGTSTEALTVQDINKVCFVLDDQTVGRIGGTNKIKAGIVREITPDGVHVEIGTLTLG